RSRILQPGRGPGRPASPGTKQGTSSSTPATRTTTASTVFSRARGRKKRSSEVVRSFLSCKRNQFGGADSGVSGDQRDLVCHAGGGDNLVRRVAVKIEPAEVETHLRSDGPHHDAPQCLRERRMIEAETDSAAQVQHFDFP